MRTVKRCDCCHTTSGTIRRFASITLCAECRVIYRAELEAEQLYIERNTLNHFEAIAPDNRLACMIRRLSYGDCLTCGDWTLERQCCQQIAGDDASGKCLVKGTYAEYMLYRSNTFIGVFDIRTDDCTRIHVQQDRYAHYLMTVCGWTVHDTRRVIGGAIIPPDSDLSQANRLLKVPSECSRKSRRAAASQQQTA